MFFRDAIETCSDGIRFFRDAVSMPLEVLNFKHLDNKKVCNFLHFRNAYTLTNGNWFLLNSKKTDYSKSNLFFGSKPILPYLTILISLTSSSFTVPPSFPHAFNT